MWGFWTKERQYPDIIDKVGHPRLMVLDLGFQPKIVGVEELTGLVQCSACMHETLICTWKCCAWEWMLVISAPGRQTQEDPCNSFASQSSLIGELHALSQRRWTKVLQMTSKAVYYNACTKSYLHTDVSLHICIYMLVCRHTWTHLRKSNQQEDTSVPSHKGS